MSNCKILFFAANPQGTGPLSLDEESRQIDQKIRASDHRDVLEFIPKFAVRPDDLLQYLNQHRPQVVHFSGHGSPTDEIILLDASGEPKPVNKAAIKQLFKALKDNIRVVVLNACFSRPQAEAITEVIDCAVGMKKAIGDKAAIVFAASFYRAIGFGRSVQEAFDQGKTALMLEGIAEEKTPELLIRQGTDPTSIFLVEHGLPAPAVDEEQRERASLIAILDERAKSITSKWDAIVQVLEKASGKNSTKETRAKDSFKELKTRFLDLHKKHIAAVMHRDVHLAHELTGTIYEVLENFRETVWSLNSEIGGQWYGNLPRRYFVSPESGTDPNYDAVGRDLLELNESTVERAKEMEYPGPPPSSLSPELSSLGFRVSSS